MNRERKSIDWLLEKWLSIYKVGSPGVPVAMRPFSSDDAKRIAERDATEIIANQLILDLPKEGDVLA